MCNGCRDEPRCVLRKKYYQHDAAQKNYREVLVQTRTGANYSEAEIAAFDATLHELLLKGQSVHAAMTNNPGLFPMCEKTVYRYIAGGLLSSKNHHLPEKMKLKPRKGRSVEHKVDATCRIGRTYEDYQRFLAEHPGTPVVEMDTVEGVKGGKVLLTLHFMPQDFMLAFLLERKCAAAVTAVFARIRGLLRKAYGEKAEEMFMRLFPVILTDNGTEFTDPAGIENDEQGRAQTSLFYCDACQSWQKRTWNATTSCCARCCPRARPTPSRRASTDSRRSRSRGCSRTSTATCASRSATGRRGSSSPRASVRSAPRSSAWSKSRPTTCASSRRCWASK